MVSRIPSEFLAALLVLAGCSAASSSLPSGNGSAALPADAYAKLTASPNPILFSGVGETRELTIREDGFTGHFTIAVPKDCNRVGFLPGDLTGPVATAELRSAVLGACVLTITGGDQRVHERVVIGTRG